VVAGDSKEKFGTGIGPPEAIPIAAKRKNAKAGFDLSTSYPSHHGRLAQVVFLCTFQTKGRGVFLPLGAQNWTVASHNTHLLVPLSTSSFAIFFAKIVELLDELTHV
jgi:hypothetical protein